MVEPRVVRVGAQDVGDPRTPFIVAEMAWAHDGRRENALRIADEVATAGAGALNVHLTDIPSYMARDYGTGAGRVSAGKETRPIFEYLNEIALTSDDWITVAARVKQHGLALSVMCNDSRSLALADTLGPDVHVLAPACVGDVAFVRALGSRKLPVMLSIGGSTLGEVEAMIEQLLRAGAAGIILQYGYQAYPTRAADLDLRYIATLRDTFGWPVGYHDHTDADDELAITLPLVALGAGASVLEKHVTHDRSAKGEDFESALVGSELARFVSLVRAAAPALGTGRWRPLTDGERAYRSVVRKRARAAHDLEKGARLSAEAVVFMRSDAGLLATEFSHVEGRPVRRPLRSGEPIDWADVE